MRLGVGGRSPGSPVSDPITGCRLLGFHSGPPSSPQDCVLLLMSPAWSLPSLGSGCPQGFVADVTDDTVFEVTVHEALCVAGMNPGYSHRLEGGVSLRGGS